MLVNKKLFDKYYWFPVILTTVLCFGFTLTNHAIGVDDPTPQFAWYIDSKILLSQGRWGYELISPLVNVSAFLPGWTDLISLCIYLVTGMIWVDIFTDASGGRYAKGSGVAFSCLYISFPYLARIYIYMLADLLSAYNMFFASLGTWSVWKIYEIQARRKRNFIIAVACIAIGYGFYESTVIYFACGIMISLFLKSVFGCIDTIKNIFYRLTMACMIVCCGFFLNRLILKIFLIHYSQNSIQYIGGYFAYDLSKNIFAQIWYVVQELIKAIAWNEDLVYFTLRLSIVFLLLGSVYVSWVRKKIQPVLLAIGVIISNFALILGTGNLEIMYDVVQNKQRMLVTYGLFTSFCISLFVTFAMQLHIKWSENMQKIIKYAVIAGVSILVLRQSREMEGIFLADYQRAALDRQKAGYINYEVEKYDWQHKPVIYVGYAEDYLATREQDPLSSYFHFFGQWTELENHNYISFYMSGLGYIYPVGLEKGMLEEALQISKGQPSYPMEGYVTEYDNYIVVKLGDK